jgi:hypothetical protein
MSVVMVRCLDAFLSYVCKCKYVYVYVYMYVYVFVPADTCSFMHAQVHACAHSISI